MKQLAIFVLIFISHFTSGQTLSLDDIISIRTMDSVELRTFCYSKGFELRELDVDSWRTVHRYYAISDSTVRIHRTFPTGRKLFPENTSTSDNRMVYFYYNDKEVQKEFKIQMKEKGFKFKVTDTKDYGGNRFTHNIYLTSDWEIDLSSAKLIGQKTIYTLIYYRRVN